MLAPPRKRPEALPSRPIMRATPGALALQALSLLVAPVRGVSQARHRPRSSPARPPAETGAQRRAIGTTSLAMTARDPKFSRLELPR